jgi:hypothetical protein
MLYLFTVPSIASLQLVDMDYIRPKEDIMTALSQIAITANAFTMTEAGLSLGIECWLDFDKGGNAQIKSQSGIYTATNRKNGARYTWLNMDTGKKPFVFEASLGSFEFDGRNIAVLDQKSPDESGFLLLVDTWHAEGDIYTNMGWLASSGAPLTLWSCDPKIGRYKANQSLIWLTQGDSIEVAMPSGKAYRIENTGGKLTRTEIDYNIVSAKVNFEMGLKMANLECIDDKISTVFAGLNISWNALLGIPVGFSPDHYERFAHMLIKLEKGQINMPRELLNWLDGNRSLFGKKTITDMETVDLLRTTVTIVTGHARTTADAKAQARRAKGLAPLDDKWTKSGIMPAPQPTIIMSDLMIG